MDPDLKHCPRETTNYLRIFFQIPAGCVSRGRQRCGPDAGRSSLAAGSGLPLRQASSGLGLLPKCRDAAQDTNFARYHVWSDSRHCLYLYPILFC